LFIMGVRERREREREEVRGKILDAARELFVADGYEAVTMRKVADRIEYSPTAIYLHFADKESLMRELCATDFLSLAKQFQKIARVEDPVERLRRIGLAYMDFAVERPSHYRLMFMTPHPPIGEHLLQKGNPEEDAYGFLVATVSEAIEKKLFLPHLKDAQLVAQVVWASVHGVISLQIAKGNDPWVEWRPVKKAAALAIDAVLRGLEASPSKRGA
jgi:AcrR family transcriptional regulator